MGKDLEFLTPKQRQLLAELARNPGLQEPTAKAFVDKVSLMPKGISDALKTFYLHDLIEKDHDGCIYVIDPVIAFWAAR